ncbi:MAG TPA: universal stress protein [Candidatus Saccharimonadales bacterium]|nr:universal stress protein [Candidatus Saccharimonadales bacterium]
MKILLATDGSPSARQAEDLAATTSWPSGTEIDALCVDQLLDRKIDLETQRFLDAHDAMRRAIDDRLAALVERLDGPGRTVRARVVFGRPATAIVDEARELGSELIIIGTHNHGALAAFTLGSVAAEVVDHSPCPVLVARRPTLGPIVLGHDGSAGARQAEELVASWPFLARETIRVVSVSPLLAPWYAGATVGMGPVIDGDFLQALLDEQHAELRRTADAAAARLVERGVRATADTRDGSAADGLLDAIAGAKAELVVVGSRGNTGLTRLLLGSVARTVLYQARCSVLIVRETKRVPPVAAAREHAIALV